MRLGRPFWCPGVRPPTKKYPKLTQNAYKCITFGASPLGLFGLTFPLKIVIGAKTLKHTLHAKHHCMSVHCLSGHLGTWTYWTTHLLFRGTVAVWARAPLDIYYRLPLAPFINITDSSAPAHRSKSKVGESKLKDYSL